MYGYTLSVYNPWVIRSFSDGGTADLLYGDDTRAARRFPKDLWPRIQRKLIILDTAKQLGDLAAVPGNRLEALRGDQKGRCSIRVNDQFRLTFRFVGPDCYEVRCEDYH
jgi:proteic killer suppression protein